MIRGTTLLLGVAASLLLTACGERAQTIGAAARKSDTKAWETSESAYAAPGYQAGDRARWEAQLRTRAQSQNDYASAK